MVRQTRDGIVEFCFFRPHVNHVALSGDFNGWHQTSLPMSKGPDGWWRYRLKLACGCYHFRYLADGQWYTDYAAFGLEKGPYGFNSVVKVDFPENKRVQFAEPISDHEELLKRADSLSISQKGWHDTSNTQTLVAARSA